MIVKEKRLKFGETHKLTKIFHTKFPVENQALHVNDPHLAWLGMADAVHWTLSARQIKVQPIFFWVVVSGTVEEACANIIKLLSLFMLKT